MTDQIKSLTDERGRNYGHPRKHFLCTQTMYAAWCESREKAEQLDDIEKELAYRHGVYMILDKLARMSENPMLKDNVDDIQGYARCIWMVLE